MSKPAITPVQIPYDVNIYMATGRLDMPISAAPPARINYVLFYKPSGMYSAKSRRYLFARYAAVAAVATYGPVRPTSVAAFIPIPIEDRVAIYVLTSL